MFAGGDLTVSSASASSGPILPEEVWQLAGSMMING